MAIISERSRFWVLYFFGPITFLALVLIFRHARTSPPTPPVALPVSNNREKGVQSASDPTSGSPNASLDTSHAPIDRAPKSPEDTLNAIADETLTTPRQEQLAMSSNSDDWKDFYNKANALRISFAEMKKLVLNRLSDELKMTDAQKTATYNLLRQEEKEISEQVYAKYISFTHLMNMMRESKARQAEIEADIRHIRDSVRRGMDPQFFLYFTENQMMVINERLRGQSLLYGHQDGRDIVGSITGYLE